MTPWRSFEVYPIDTMLMDAELVSVPLANERFDIEGLAAAITDRTKLLLLATPNNPIGPATSTEELRALLERIPPSVIVLIDEAYREFVDPGPGTPCTSFLNVVVTLSTSGVGLAGPVGTSSATDAARDRQDLHLLLSTFAVPGRRPEREAYRRRSIDHLRALPGGLGEQWMVFANPVNLGRPSVQTIWIPDRVARDRDPPLRWGGTACHDRLPEERSPACRTRAPRPDHPISRSNPSSTAATLEPSSAVAYPPSSTSTVGRSS